MQGFAPGRGQPGRQQNAMPAQHNGGFPRQGPISSGSATLASLGGIAVHPRGNMTMGAAPGQLQQAQRAPGPVSNPADPQGTNRWPAGSYSITPPDAEVTEVNVPKPGSTGVIAPGRPFVPQQQQQQLQYQQQVQPKQGMHQQYQQQNMYANKPAQGGPTHLQPQMQQQQQRQYVGSNDYQSMNGRDVTQLAGGFNGMSLHPQNQQQYQLHGNQQVIGQQLQQPPQYSGTYTFSMPINGTNVGMTVSMSPPVSPLPAYLASPVMGSQTIYNPFVNGGFSPLLSSMGLQGMQGMQGSLASYMPTGVSPLMSPGTAMLPRDVVFEENISNAHNLFTPATYVQHSPLVGAREMHYSPAMYQATFAVNANAFAPQGGANNFDLPIYGANGGNRKQMQKARKSPAGDASRAMPKTAGVEAPVAASPAAVAEAPVSAPSTAPKPADEVSVESVDAPASVVAEVVPEQAADSPPTAQVAVADGGSFFDAVPDSANCSPLERDTDLQMSEQDSPSGDTTSESGAAMSSNTGASQAGGADAGSANGTPTKSVGPSRRNMIIKHTKQLVA
jgi:hypothetical protein